MENKIVILEYVATEKQLADIFTKALNVVRFGSLRTALGLCVMKKKNCVKKKMTCSFRWGVSCLKGGFKGRFI